MENNQKERMINGKYYLATHDDSLFQQYLKASKITQKINTMSRYDFKTINKLVSELFGQFDETCILTPPFQCDYGSNVYCGSGFYANYDCIFLDVCPIVFGTDVFIGPRCSFITACHPIDKTVRNTRIEYGKPIKVGNNVWFGANVTVCPGVTIGDDVVIGAGSVVCKDLPSHSVCVGNPCHKIRDITEDDYLENKSHLDEWEEIFGKIN